MPHSITWTHRAVCVSNGFKQTSLRVERCSPPAPFHQSTGATEEERPHWTHPGKLWFDFQPHGKTATLPSGCTPHKNTVKAFHSRSDWSRVWWRSLWGKTTWCILLCSPQSPGCWCRPVSGHETWSSPRSPCLLRSTSPDHIPRCYCLWGEERQIIPCQGLCDDKISLLISLELLLSDTLNTLKVKCYILLAVGNEKNMQDIGPDLSCHKGQKIHKIWSSFTSILSCLAVICSTAGKILQLLRKD